METVGDKIQLRSEKVIATQSVTPSSLIGPARAGGASFLILEPPVFGEFDFTPPGASVGQVCIIWIPFAFPFANS